MALHKQEKQKKKNPQKKNVKEVTGRCRFTASDAISSFLMLFFQSRPVLSAISDVLAKAILQ